MQPVQKLRDTLASAPDRAELRNELESLRQRIEELGDDASDAGWRGYRRARSSAVSGGKALNRELVRLERESRSTLVDRPFQSVLVAFGLGLLVAGLIGYGGSED